MPIRSRWRFFRARYLSPRPAPHLVAFDQATWSGWKPEGRADYLLLARYFFAGYEAYRSPLGATALYPGRPSIHGLKRDGMEGFARIAPLAATWLAQEGCAPVPLFDGSSIDLEARLRTAFEALSDPKSAEFWGQVFDGDQAIVEAADLALALWIGRKVLWDPLTPEKKNRIARWLLQVNGRRVPDNNWHLFVLLVNVVLAALGAPHDAAKKREHYERFRSFHLGGGWFSDGPRGRVDFYNAWQMHYSLHWLRSIEPTLDTEFLEAATRDFSASFLPFFGPTGFPILGRSISYRLALPAPLILLSGTAPRVVAPSQARRALDHTWRYFVHNGALRGGGVTQGYLATDLRVVEAYACGASPLYSLRSLVAALLQPADAPFWVLPSEKLPVEKESYRYAIPSVGWEVDGNVKSGVVTLHRRTAASARGGAVPRMRRYSPLRRLREMWAGRVLPPNNAEAAYERPSYASDRPFLM